MTCTRCCGERTEYDREYGDMPCSHCYGSGEEPCHAHDDRPALARVGDMYLCAECAPVEAAEIEAAIEWLEEVA